MWQAFTKKSETDTGKIYLFEDNVLDDLFDASSELAKAIHFGDVENWSDTYLAFNDENNIVSFNYMGDEYSPFDAELLSEYLAKYTSVYKKHQELFGFKEDDFESVEGDL